MLHLTQRAKFEITTLHSPETYGQQEMMRRGQHTGQVVLNRLVNGSDDQALRSMSCLVCMHIE